MQVKTTPVPNFLLDEHLRNLKGTELKMLLVIIRQTLGWKKESDWISASQLKAKTGCSQRSITSAIEMLAGKNFIEVFSEEGELLDMPEKRKGKKRMFYKLSSMFHSVVGQQGKTSGEPRSYPQTCAKLS
ncbi:MAG: replication protein [Bacteroidetes bacterium]|nr:replication protein [Bacteroidota bacterium]